MEVRDPSDWAVKDMHAQVVTGRKKRTEKEEVVGRVQTGWAGLGWGEPPSLWSRSNKKGRKDLFVSEDTRIEQKGHRVKAVAQGQQRRWTMWEGVVNQAIN